MNAQHATTPALGFGSALVVRGLQFYHRFVSPLLHFGASGACRFQPTCSEYAVLAVAHYGAARGGGLALRRLLRCHPGCAGGFDPVPGTWPASSSPGAELPRGR